MSLLNNSGPELAKSGLTTRILTELKGSNYNTYGKIGQSEVLHFLVLLPLVIYLEGDSRLGNLLARVIQVVGDVLVLKDLKVTLENVKKS